MRDVETVRPLAQFDGDPDFVVAAGSSAGGHLATVDEARAFVERLRSVSAAKVGYAESPGVGRGFDLLDGARTGAVVNAIGRFLGQVHKDRSKAQAGAAI